MSTLGEAKAREKQQTAERLLIRSLVQQNVKYIFGIPGGKIMPTFDVLRDEGPQLIVCRHEQNAAFMAAAVGRLTGRPGVCLVTSGPGTGNLVTGAATATTEGDPMVAIGGIVPLADTLKQRRSSPTWRGPWPDFVLRFMRRVSAWQAFTCTFCGGIDRPEDTRWTIVFAPVRWRFARYMISGWSYLRRQNS
jgi:hypothetical protein